MAGKEVQIPLPIINHFRFADVYSICPFVALSVLSLRLFGITTGKRLLRLRVIGPRPVPSLRRELIRNAPHLLVVLGLFALTEFAPAYATVPPTVRALAVTIEVIAALALIYLWIWPIIRWRGAFPHNRWLGLVVAPADTADMGAPNENT